jgi:hypothetical protein
MQNGDLKAALSKAFDNLRKKGFIARQRYMCCGGCGWAGIASDIREKGLKPTGIVFFHKQDAEVFTERRFRGKPKGLHLAFGHPSDDEQKVVEVGKTIVAEFGAFPCIKVEWDGTAHQRIYVKEVEASVESVRTEEDEIEERLESSGNDGEHDDKPVVELLGFDGNAFLIIGKCLKAAKKAGWEQSKIDAVQKEMTGGDYSNLLAVAMKYFEVQ